MRRAASAMFTIDPHRERRLNRGVVDGEGYAAGALIALIAGVFHSYLRNQDRSRGGRFGAAASSPFDILD